MPGTAEHVQYGFLMATRKSGYGANPHALAKKMDNLFAFGRINAGFVQGLRLAKSGSAAPTLEPLNRPVFIPETARFFDFQTRTTPTTPIMQLTLSGLCSKLSVNRLDSDLGFGLGCALLVVKTLAGRFLL